MAWVPEERKTRRGTVFASYSSPIFDVAPLVREAVELESDDQEDIKALMEDLNKPLPDDSWPPHAGTVMYNLFSLEGGIHCIKPSSLQGAILDIVRSTLGQPALFTMLCRSLRARLLGVHDARLAGPWESCTQGVAAIAGPPRGGHRAVRDAARAAFSLTTLPALAGQRGGRLRRGVHAKATFGHLQNTSTEARLIGQQADQALEALADARLAAEQALSGGQGEAVQDNQ
ncbi:hypothetical protein B0H14DRAFT_2564943 [Mycena olivaceomarginata]|nr:hypothetical protein B0H14DRAFT_2564943 [Mycena olivaceomarginata]